MTDFFAVPATRYAQAGGDLAYARRQQKFVEMQGLARTAGLLGREQEAPDATGFKGMFFNVVDLISRPTYAVAGIADTLQGTGQAGENAFERAFREMFSGIGPLQGDKEAFGQVLEQGGFGKGADLASLIGDNGLTRNFNPNTRDAVGLALDIALDPLTYISAPAKGAAMIIGVGGEVRYLTKAGRAALSAGQSRKVDAWRRVLGTTDDVSDDILYKRIAETDLFAKRNGAAAKAMAQSPETFLMEVERTFVKETGQELSRRVSREVAATGGSALVEKTGLRFRPFGLIDVPVGLDRAVMHVGGKLWDGMSKFELGRAVRSSTEETFQHIDALFNRVPLLARKNAAYRRIEAERFMRNTAAKSVAQLEAKTLMAGIHRRHWDNQDLWRNFAVALETGGRDSLELKTWAKEAEAIGVEGAEGFAERWIQTFDRVGLNELDAGLLNSAEFETYRGRYFHRIIDHLKGNQQKDLTRYTHSRTGKLSAGGHTFQEKRLLKGWMDFEENAVAKGIAKEDLITNPFEVAKARLGGHYEDMINLQFLDEVSTQFGFKMSDDYTKMQSILTEMTEEATEDELKVLAGLDARGSTTNPHGYHGARLQELERLRIETPEGEALARIKEMVDRVGATLDEDAKKLLVFRMQRQYKDGVIKRKRGKIFELRETDNQALSEARVLRASVKPLRETRAWLKSEAQRALKGLDTGHAAPLQKQARLAEEKLRGLRTAWHEVERQLDDAALRADDMDDVLAARKADSAALKYDVEALIKQQVDEVTASKALVREFKKEFKESIVRDMDGNTVRSLSTKIDNIQAHLVQIGARRKLINQRKVIIRDEIVTTKHVFDPLDQQYKHMMGQVADKRAAKRLLKQDQTVAKKEFQDAHATSLRELSAADHAAFRALRPEVQAAWLHRAMGKIDNIEHFENFLNKYGDDVTRLDTRLRDITERFSTGNVIDSFGQKYRHIDFQIGKRTKDTRVEDAALREAKSQLVDDGNLIDQVKAGQADSADTLQFLKEAGATKEAIENAANTKSLWDDRLREAKAARRDTRGQIKAYSKAKAAAPARSGTERLYLPEGIAKHLETLDKSFQLTEEVTGLLRQFDRLSNWFKIGVTRYFPAFHIRNAYSNVAASFLDIGLTALNPVKAMQALDIMRGADGTLLVGQKRVPYRMIRQEMDGFHMRVDKEMLSEVTDASVGTDFLERALTRGLKKEGAEEVLAGVAQKAYSIPGNVENHARTMHYISLRSQGFSPADAAMKVNQFLFDYSDLAASERAVFRRLFPFWAWTRKNAIRQFKNLYEHPGRVAMQTKAFAGDRGPSGDLLPEYLRGQMNIQVQQDEKGESWLTGIDLPISNMDILWAGSMGKTFREQIGLLSPLIKTPMELGLGKDTFSGKPIHGHGQIARRLGSAMDRNLPQQMKDYFELKNAGTAAEPRWTANRLKVHIVAKGMFVSRFVTSGVRLDEVIEDLGSGDAKKGLVNAVQLLSSLSLRSFTLDEKAHATLYNRSRELENMLVGSGLMREFTKRYIPANTADQGNAASGVPDFFSVGAQ